jgi:hypothetical protein
VKRYADEPGARLVRAIDVAVVSSLARVEVPAALWRKHRIGELGAADAAALTEAFEWDWYAIGAFAIVRVSDEILADAARAAAVHALRAYDAVQLATALAARAADRDLSSIACFDEQLAVAASAEGFAVLA